MKKQPLKHALVQSVEIGAPHLRACYPFFVTGLLTLANGSVECFHWHVPDLAFHGYDWTEARFTNEALKAFGL